jgi:Zn-dependent peptidase ImmA (M78 family)
MTGKISFSDLPAGAEDAARMVRQRARAEAFAIDLNKLLVLSGFEQLDAAIEGDGYFVPAGTLGSRHVIVANERAAAERKRFTIGHELGHAVLHINKHELNDAESWCDEFSAALLMPRDVVSSFANRVRRLSDWFCFAEQFRVSGAAASRRLWECERVLVARGGEMTPLLSAEYNSARAQLMAGCKAVAVCGESSGILASGEKFMMLRRSKNEFVGAASFSRNSDGRSCAPLICESGYS